MVKRVDRVRVVRNVDAPDANDKASPIGYICVKLPNETCTSVLWRPQKFSPLTLGDILRNCTVSSFVTIGEDQSSFTDYTLADSSAVGIQGLSARKMILVEIIFRRYLPASR